MPKPEEDLVEAVLMLRPPPTAIVAEPDETEQIAREVIERVTQSSGVEPQQVKVFRNLGSFAIRASADFVRELAKQPEIASSMKNDGSE